MFKRAKMDVGMTPPVEYHPMTSGEAAVIGEALTLTDGAMTKCAATTKPGYIAVGPDKDGIVPVIKVQDYMTFETTLSVIGTALKPGSVVTLADDGLQITATTADGVATIVDMAGSTAGDTVTVRF